MNANPMEWYMIATNAVTGKAKYFTRGDMKQDDYRVLMASCCIPVACRPIFIDGVPYYDGALSDTCLLYTSCGHKAGELEKIMDVVKHHQHQGDGLERGAGQPGAFCGKHTKKTPFMFYCKQCNRGLCRDSKFYIKNQAKVMLASKADLPSRSPLK